MKSLNFRIAICLLLICAAVSTACAGGFGVRDTIRLQDNQILKAVYYFPHWWDPWKSDDSAVTVDLQKMKSLGFNTICVDHEASQAVDREWAWLDREYKLAGQEKVSVLPWLQLQAADRAGLMKFTHLQFKSAVNQDKKSEDDYASFRDPEFRRALAYYIDAYLDRYINNPALLRVKSGDSFRPVVGIMLEAGWRNSSGQPLSFDDDTNAYFREWMQATYHDLNDLNKQWGTKYKSFDEIDPCDKTVFNYDFADTKNMPLPVREHVKFRARLINDTLSEVSKEVHKRHKDILFVAEVAYPFSSDSPNASVYRWNDANEIRSVASADIVFVRSEGNTTSGQMEKDQDTIIKNGKKVVLAYRLFNDSTQNRSIAFAMDCAMNANGLACYNWNEAADSASAIYGKSEIQDLAKLMNLTYDLLNDPAKRHVMSSPGDNSTAQPAATVTPAVVIPALPPVTDVPTIDAPK